MDKLADYLHDVCKNVKFTPAHFGIKRELNAHFEDQIHEYVQIGMTQEDALEASIADMGDPYDLGDRLNQVHKPQREWNIVLFLVSMLCFSILISAVFQFIAVPKYYYNYFFKLLIYVPVGGILIFLLYHFDYRIFIRNSTVILIVSVLLIVIIDHWGDGMLRLVIGNHAFEAMPLAGICGVIGTAASLQYCRKKHIMIEIVNVILSFYIFGMFISLGQYLWALSQLTVYIVTCIWLSKMYSYLQNYKIKKYIHIIFIILCGLLYSDTILGEITRWIPVFLDPNAYAKSEGYVFITTRTLLSSALPLGANSLLTSGQGVSNGFLKEFVLIYIISKFGYIPGFFILLAIIIFIYFICRAVWQLRNTTGGAIALACCIPLLFQFFVAISTNLGFILPGLYSNFPFMSVGGVFLASNMILIAIILSIWRTRLEYQVLYEK
jgi:cell division protein FtsW (lipid II flippase)